MAVTDVVPWPAPDQGDVPYNPDAIPNGNNDPGLPPAQVASFQPPPVSQQPPMTMANAQPAPPMRGIAYPGAGGQAPSPAPQLGMVAGLGPRPAHFQPGERTIKETTKVSPYSEAADTAALGNLGAQDQLAQAQAEAGGAQYEADKQVGNLTGLYDQSVQLSRDVRHKQQMAELHDYHQKITNLMTEASNYKEDPMKWFHDRSTGSQILTAIGLIASGFGYGYSGRGMNPSDVINKMIEHSVAQQRSEHAGKSQELTEARQQFADLRQQFGDDESAALASEAAKRQFVIAHLQQTAQDQTAPAMSRLASAKLLADQRQRQSQTLQQLDERRLTAIEKTGSEKYVPASNGAGALGVTVQVGDKKVVIPVAQYEQLQKAGIMPAAGLDARKTEAETRKLEAEAKVAEGKAGGDRSLDRVIAAGQGLKSTAFMHDPVAWFAQNFQGTDASSTALKRDSINAVMMGQAHKQFGARTPEAQEHIMAPYLVQSGDRPDRIKEKIENFRTFIANGPDYDPGQGAVEE